MLIVSLGILAPVAAWAETGAHLTFKSTAVIETQDYYGVSISPDGTRVAWAVAHVSGPLGSRCTVDGQPLGAAYESIEKPVFSPDSKHIAFIARVPKNESAFVFDGKELQTVQSNKKMNLGFTPAGELYYSYPQGPDAVIVMNGQKYIAHQAETGVRNVGSPIEFSFSADGKHWAGFWEDSQYERHFIRDGKESPLIGVESWGGTRGGHVAIIERDGAQRRVVFDGVPQKSYPELTISDLTLGGDGSHLFYIAGGRLVIDGQESPTTTTRSFAISRNGRHYATVDASNKLVIDGTEMDWKLVPMLGNEIVVSDDGKQVAYPAELGGPVVLAHDGKRVGPESFRIQNIVLSSDGTRVACLSMFNDRRSPQLIIDGAPAGDFSDVAKIIFSPDGKHVAALAVRGRSRIGGKWFVYLDGAEAPCAKLLDGTEPGLGNDGILHFYAGTARGSSQTKIERLDVQLAQ